MLYEQLQLCAQQDRYDFIIIDTPPALNILTINAYVTSTGLIIPMEPEILSLVGVSQLRIPMKPFALPTILTSRCWAF